MARRSTKRNTRLKIGITPRCPIEKTLLKALAGAAEARHHRSYGCSGDTRDLEVRKLFQFAQHQHLAILQRQFVQRFSHQLRFLLLEQRSLRVSGRLADTMYSFVEGAMVSYSTLL